MSRTFSHGPFDFRTMSPAIRFLIAANAAAFLLTWVVGAQVYDLFGLVPVHFFRDRWIWEAATYLFIHGGIAHLLINMFCLWMFAMPIEAQWGSRELMKYYFLCGVGAGLVTAALSPSSPIPTIGASGAVYGLLVAFAMLYPDSVVYLYFLFPVKARDMVILVGLVEFFAGASGNASGIARFTHLSGILIGWVYIRWWWVVKIKIKSLWRAMLRGSAGASIRPAGSPARRPARAADPAPGEPMDEIDRILDKISAQGKESLSPEELDLLKRLSEKRRPEGHA